MNQNNAAQPVLTNDEIATHFKRFWAFNAYEQDNLMAAARAVIADALSKLRAPVADERAQQRNEGFASLSLWWTMTEAEAELIGKPIKDDRPILSFMGSGASHQVTAGDIRAALASAPVTGENAAHMAGLETSINILSALVDHQRLLLVEVENVCGRDGHGGPLEDGESDLIDRVRQHLAATIPAAQPAASAPVAGEAQSGDYVQSVPEHCDRIVWKGRYYALPLDAAPQASEAVRDQALTALESAQRFIRNGVEFGYIRMPDADTPDPAHNTPRLIDEAIAAIKSQADEPAISCSKCGDDHQDCGLHDVQRWVDLVWRIAKELNCLPSSFVDGNEHVLRAARQASAALSAQPGAQKEQSDAN